MVQSPSIHNRAVARSEELMSNYDGGWEKLSFCKLNDSLPSRLQYWVQHWIHLLFIFHWNRCGGSYWTAMLQGRPKKCSTFSVSSGISLQIKATFSWSGAFFPPPCTLYSVHPILMVLQELYFKLFVYKQQWKHCFHRSRWNMCEKFKVQASG